MKTITTADDTRLYYKDWGAGRPVILMHGWPLSSDSWDDQAMAIADAGFRTIAYDRRGFGRSSQPGSGYDYDTLADDLATVIEQTGAQEAVLVGFSMGSVFAGMTKGMKEDRAKFFGSFFKDFFGSSMLSSKVSDETIEWARSMSMQAGLNATLGCAKAFATTDFRPDLAAFKVPTLIIHGTDDKTVPIDAAGRAAAKGIAQSTLIEYDGAPHGLQVTHKERLTKDLLDFIQG